MMITRDRLRARAGPTHRLAGALCGQQHRQELRIDFVAHAKAAADVVGVDAELGCVEAGDRSKRGLDVRDALGRAVQIVHVHRGVVARQAGLRLHRIAGDALRGDADADDMRRLGECLLGAGAVAVFVFEAQVVGHLVVDAWRRCLQRLVRIDHDRQILVFDLDLLGGVLREVLGLRDDNGHRLADEAHAPVRQARTKRNAHRAAADTLEERENRRRLPAGRNDVGAGDDVEHALRLARLGGVDPHDLPMRAVGAQEVRRDLSVEMMIGGVAAAAGDQPLVLPAAPELMLCQFRIPNWFVMRSMESPSFRAPPQARLHASIARRSARTRAYGSRPGMTVCVAPSSRLLPDMLDPSRPPRSSRGPRNVPLSPRGVARQAALPLSQCTLSSERGGPGFRDRMAAWLR